MKEDFKSSGLYDVEFEEPAVVTGFYPYEVARVDPSSDGEYTLNKGWCNQDEYKPAVVLHDRLYKLLLRTDPKHCMDNKVVYIYKIKNGEEIAVQFKDCVARFGRRESIRLCK